MAKAELFSAPDASKVTIAIMGDLHLEAETMPLFHEARQHLNRILTDESRVTSPEITAVSRVVQLGDLGAYTAGPGSNACFQLARSYLDGFTAPNMIITGNHDLEGAEFDTDQANLQAWHDAFEQHHHWVVDVGPAICVGLSTTRFRGNHNSVHEVHIDRQQMDWLRETLAHPAYRGRPTVLFSHAPPAGCGLKVINSVHVKNRCAWLNHSSDPLEFMRLVDEFPQIRLWFSGHFHLSHNYNDSIVGQGATAFVQTGVIGECNRDGLRQSRVLQMDHQGYRILTVDHHDDGATRVDLTQRWDDLSTPKQDLAEEELLCDPAAGFLCGRDACDIIGKDIEDVVTWYPCGGDVILAAQDDVLVEYSVAAASPMGAVVTSMKGRHVVLRDARGKDVTDDMGDGSNVVTVVLVGEDGDEEIIPRNAEGGFFQIFQHNKWVKKMREMGKEELIEAQRALTLESAVLPRA